ncbi:MAG: hypothetical protein LBP64_06150, partial [Tannerella sp.]|nr:hypothetical protein [Tannerella sp.]
MKEKKRCAETQKQAKTQKSGYIETGTPVRQKLRHANVWTVLLISVLLLTAACAEKSTGSDQTAKNEQTVKQ